jgi:histone demethylase JARID1
MATTCLQCASTARTRPARRTGRCFRRARATIVLLRVESESLARARGSLLRHVHHTLPGITDPMLYVGMLFTTFCWHTEDNYLASINYLHGGAPKVWYGVPSSHRAQFEALMRARYGELFALHPDLLFQLVTTLNPRELHEHNIPCVRAVQRGGEFVITFPASFHAGFNCGFNVAEAVNFGSEHWLPFGRRSIEDYHKRDGNRPSAFSYHNLLCHGGARRARQRHAARTAARRRR